MAGPALLKIDIVADASKAAATFGKVGDAAGKAGDKVEKSGSKFGGFIKNAAKVAAAGALGGVVAMFKTGLDEQSDFLAGQAQLANGLKTTGNAANTSVKGMEDLASSVQNYSGQTDDSIVASEKLLLTFTNIRNKGKGTNAIFDEATKMTADMAAKMGGDASKYAVQLGKALNDPAKGVSKLTKIGVTFTDAQKKQIAAMQKAGDTVGAQKVIMAELRKEFGGSAKAAGQTLPGQMARAKRSFEDVSQGLVASFMPILTKLADILTTTVLPAFQATIGWMTKHKGVVLAFAAAIGAVYAAIKVGQATSKLSEAGGLVSWIKQTNLAAGATKIWAGIQAVFNAIMDANPIVLIVLGIAALVAIIVIAYKKSATFRKIVQAAFAGIVSVAKILWAGLKLLFSFWMAQFRLVLAVVQIVAKGVMAAFDWIVSAANAVIGFFRKIPGWIASALSTLFSIITAPYRLAWNWIVNTMIPAVLGWFRKLPGWIGSALSTVTSIITAPFRAAWNWVATSLVPGIVGWVRSIPGKVSTALAGLANIIKTPFQAGWNWVKTNVINKISGAFSGLWSSIKTALSKVTSAITAPFKAAWDWIKTNIIDKITSGFGALGSALKKPINAVIRAWNNLSFTIGGFKLPFPPHTKFPSFTINTPNIPELASGGVFTRPTLAVVGEGRGSEVVAPEAMIRAILRSELANQGPTVIVNGALDPDAVARQIERILSGRARRVAGAQRIGAPAAAT
jgi:hypothetical protein